MVEVLISVLVPTYNRAPYLYYTLKSCANQEFQDVEFVICDDASSDNTHEVVNSFVNADTRFSYHRSSANRGMLENFEAGLDLLRGDYVIALGSDDILMPNSLQIIQKRIEHDNIQLMTWVTAAYFYQGTKDAYGQLVIPNKNLDGSIENIVSSEFLSRLAKNLNYMLDEDCPMIYVKGIVQRSLIEQVRERSGGRFYSCSTPDGYSGVVLAGEVNSFHKLNAVLTMHGVSPSSAGVNYVSANSESNDLSQKFFADSTKRSLHKDLSGAPYSPLLSIMTADFLLTARDLPGWKGSFGKICYKTLITKAIQEVCDGLIDDKKIRREVEIIKIISIASGEEKLFNELMSNSYRNKRSHLKRDAMSRRLIYINAEQNEIFNAFDASYFVKNFVNLRRTTSLKRLLTAFVNSVDYGIKSKKRSTALKHYID
jgi:glycosyltransferase involved in cell wall biosynthesis